MSLALLVLLLGLATYRATVLIVADKIAQPIVEPIQEFFEKRWEAKHPDTEPGEQYQSWVGYLLGCPHCVSVWISGIFTVITDLWFEPLPLPVLVFGAAAAIASFLATARDALDAAASHGND